VTAAGRARAALVAALLVALAGCLPAPRGGLFGLGGSERRLYDSALETARRDPAAGRLRLWQFLRTYPRSALADDAGLALARLERVAGRDRDAERALRAALAGQPRGDRSDAARLELAELLHARGDDEAAWRELQAVRASLLDTEMSRRAARLGADLASARGDPRAELVWLARLRASAGPDEDVAALDAEVGAAMAALPTDALLQAAEGLGTQPPAGRVWLEAAERSMREGDPARARRALARSERASLDAAEREQWAALEAWFESGADPAASARGADLPPRLAAVEGGAGADTEAASGTIGVVLPLSGPFAAVAEQTLRGVLLAAGVFEAGEAGSGEVQVLVRDSGASPERAAAAVRELAARGVAAVVGPLLAEEAQAAGAAAEETGMPLVALTREESVVRPGGRVFRVGLTRRMEAEVLAEHAVHDLGLRRFAILHPQDDYGREFEALLWQALEARGARVVAVAGYDPASSDFSGPIRSLVGWSLLSDAERADVERRRPEAGAARAAAGAPLWSGSVEIEQDDQHREESDPLPPIVDFDALFIPDAADKVALIAPQLSAESVEGVTLFGSSAWHHGDLVRGAGPRLDGAFFTTAFDASHPAPLVQEFVRRHREAFGSPANAFAAQGFDAANLVLSQVVRGAATHDALRQGLLETRLYPGVSGVTSFDLDGNARKRPFLVGVQGGALVSLE
jgi:ABC-type branched-subunit amino acid transport system substrate-binding protein